MRRLGTDLRDVAGSLVGQISEQQRQEWSSVTPAAWAVEAFALARGDAYGLLPPSDHGTCSLLPASWSKLRGMSHFSSVGRRFGWR